MDFSFHLKKEWNIKQWREESKVTREFFQQIMSEQFSCGALVGGVPGENLPHRNLLAPPPHHLHMQPG